MRHALLALVLAAATPAQAVDPPPAPRLDAALRERFFLASEEVGELPLLAARIGCVAHHRGRIDGFIAQGGLSRGWSREAERFWQLARALDAFETAFIRPHVDRDTQAAFVGTYFDADTTADDDRVQRCASFGDPFALRRLVG